MVLNGAEWCWMVPNGTEWCRMVPSGTKCRRMVMKGAEWGQMVSNGSKRYQMGPNGTECYLMLMDGKEWYQLVPNGARGCWMVLNGAIYNQSIPIFKNEMDSDLFGANSTILFHTILQHLAHLGSIRHPSTPLGTIPHLSVLLCTIGNHLGTIWYNSSIIWYHWASFSTIGQLL